MDNLKWILTIIGAAAVVGLVMYLLWPKPTPQPLQDGFKPAVSVESEPTPAGMGEDYSGKVTVTIRDTIPPSTTPTPREYKTEVLIPKNPDKTPPLVRTQPDSVTSISTYAEFTEPIVAIRWGLLVGGSISGTGQPSPWAGISVLQAFSSFNLGGAASRSGVGPFVGWEFFREFNVTATWNVVKFGDKPSAISLGLAYRF